MKILLIQPPVRDFYQTAIRTQPIGLAYLAAALEQTGCDVEILDCQITNQKKSIPVPERFSSITEFYPRGDLSPFRLFSGYHHFGLSSEEIAGRIRHSRADVIGISSQFTPYCEEALTIASLVKSVTTTTPVIMGGAHVSAAPSEVLKHPAVDYVVTGEAEATLSLLIDSIKQGRQPLDLDGVGYRVNGKAHINPKRFFINDIDTLAFPARHLLDFSLYTMQGRPYTVLISSRGCPQGCTYCSVSQVMGTAFRARSAAAVIEEIKHCREKYGISLFDIEDDNFTLDQKRALQMLNAIIEEFGEDTLQFFAMNGLSIFSLNKELLEKMKRAGFHHLDLSLGSVSRHASTQINRPYDPEKTTRILSEAAACRLPTTTYIIYGIPGHHVADMVQSLRYLAQQQTLIGPSIFYPTPGTPAYTELYGEHHAPDFTALRSSLFPVETEQFSRVDLITLLRLSRWVNFIKQVILPELGREEISLQELAAAAWLPEELRNPAQTAFPMARSGPMGTAASGRIMTAVFLCRGTPWGIKRLRRKQQNTCEYHVFPYKASQNVLALFQGQEPSLQIRGILKKSG
jgi:anaerobic magnesium-protoporphyrin IX monomethyl ester cyclase